MEEILGATVAVFIGLTVVIFGGAAFMTGEALATTWRPMWQAVPYALLLATANRFFSFALFDGELLSISGFVISGVVLAAIALAAYSATRAHKMVAQYPWLYERSGLFSWRDKSK